MKTEPLRKKGFTFFRKWKEEEAARTNPRGLGQQRHLDILNHTPLGSAALNPTVTAMSCTRLWDYGRAGRQEKSALTASARKTQ